MERVIIVDDESLVRKTLIKMIESNDTGWEVAGEASNGLEALELLEEVKPELLITDIRMPKMDGIRLAEALYTRGDETKVIVLTGYKDFEYAQAALKFGVVDFLLKPCPEDEVCEALGKVRQIVRKNKEKKQMEQEYAGYSSRIESLEAQFMSYILIGNLKQLEHHIDDSVRRLANSPLQEARMEAFVLVVALDRIVRKQFSTSTVRLDLGAEVAELHQLQQMKDIQLWIHRRTGTLTAEIVRWSENNNHNLIYRAKKYIEDHFMERCGLQDVAAHVFLNYKYFGQLFKRETGESFVNYVTRVRLEKASLLLNNTDLMVTQIAKLCGYDDPNYFTTVFRKAFNMTPNEYRIHHKTTGGK